MDPLFTISNNIGKAYRVVRKGYHYVVEARMRDGTWDPIYKCEVVGTEPPELALRACIRKSLFYSDEEFQHLALLALMIAANDPKLGSPNLTETLLTHLPRDAMLIARVPKQLKDSLQLERQRFAERIRTNPTLSDYLIYRLANGGR